MTLLEWIALVELHANSITSTPPWDDIERDSISLLVREGVPKMAERLRMCVDALETFQFARDMDGPTKAACMIVACEKAQEALADVEES
jgi:hypothetical protein